jgi:cell division protein FtsI (penicillin-binding protein 3)
MPDAKPSRQLNRLYIFAGLLLVWVAAIGYRLVHLQVIHYGEFQQRAARQQQRTIEVSPRRGIIFDRNGHELALSVSVDSVFAVPSEINDQQATSEVLGKVLGLDASEIRARMKASHAFAWVARQLEPQTAARVRALNLRGVYFQKEPKRYYPKRDLAAQVLGYVGLDDEGLAGIERSAEDQLRGEPGKMLIQRDARGRWFGRVEQQPAPGADLVLTIDEKIQYIAERELEQAMHETRAEAGTVIIENPRTGEIWALANRPTFNPNLARGITPAQMKNRAVSDIYEPGSTFKIVTVAAALEEKLTKPEEVIDCQMGSITVGGLRIRDHKPYGLLSVEQIVANSSDVGAIKLGLRLGERKFDQYIRAFGFGSQTGIELPGETRGLTKPVQRWSKVSIGAISMGQEIGISAVQLGGLIATIANGGAFVQPRILMPSGSATDAKMAQVPGTFVPAAFHPAEQKRVISPETAARMKRILQAVVQYGTGRTSQLDGYSSAGKTGTAQKVDPNTGAYSKTKYVASFAGFAPVNEPAVVIVVILDSAVGLHQGGQIAAPVFKRIAQQVLPYLNVPHDLDLAPAKVRTMRAAVREADLEESSPDRIEGAAMTSDASVEAQLAGPEPAAPHLTPAIQQKSSSAEFVRASASLPRRNEFAPMKPQAAKPVPAGPLQPPPSAVAPPVNGTVVLELSGGTVVPSFLGKPLRAVVEQAQEQGLEVDAVGSGVAREQAPAAGARVPAGAHIAIRFGR